ncbi:hypothetical protein NMY22_g2104 [Coprinellus aureogranulatus]|nr:hypothetical protein NMY22_g2104 [Coprinellus aureogranulatus]
MDSPRNEEEEVPFVTKVDSPVYHDFLENTLVATKEKPQTRALFALFSPKYCMKDIVSQAQERLLRSGKSQTTVLTAGYSLNKRQGSPAVAGQNGVASAFQTPEWNRLLHRIGVDPIIHLLTRTSIFISLPNECLCQLTGEPITNIPFSFPAHPPEQEANAAKRSAPVFDSNTRPCKRRKLFDEVHMEKKKQFPDRRVFRTSPQDLRLARSRLFFARPCHVPHTNSIIVGLPTKQDILNQIHPSYKKTDSEGDHLQQGRNARRLAKHIFPGQYGLQTPFKYLDFRRSYVYPVFDRDMDIKILGRKPTPKRLKGVLPIMDKLIWRHTKCDYKALQNIACPTKIQDDGKLMDESVILELMSEQSIQISTQLSLRLDDVSMDSAGKPVSPLRATQVARPVQHKPKFTEFECSHYEVFRYAKLVTNAVIPKAFWGNEANYRLVLKNMKRFVELRRYETLTIHELLQGFSTSACEWLMPSGKKAHLQGRVDVSDTMKRRELLKEFMFWYFDGFLMPLLKTTFYITESSAFRNRILYFRQDDWCTLCAPLTKRLLDTMFIRIPDVRTLCALLRCDALTDKAQRDMPELMRQSKLRYSFVRLLPKDTGVRPIVNLRGSKPGQMVPGKQSGNSVNNLLRTTFDILTYERKTREHLLGASVLGNDQIYVQLKNFKKSLSDRNGALPKLYFVKVDVQACFDTIEQTKLLEIIQDLLSEACDILFQKSALNYLMLASDLAADLWNTIIVPQPLRKASENQETILKLLNDHITSNMIRIGGHYYRQRVGIPQGSILSTMLCSFFYGDLERKNEKILKLRNDPGNLLLRLVDDYLFITTSIHKARFFLDVMNQGHPEYGCFIGKDKTLTNVDYDAQVMNLVDPLAKSFPWCGHLINMQDLSVTVDYSRYGTWGISNTLTVERGRRPGDAFVAKMLLMARFKCHVIYSDSSLNPENVAYLNLYQNMLLTGMKMQEYVREANLLSRGNHASIFKTIQKVVNVAYASVQGRSNERRD